MLTVMFCHCIGSSRFVKFLEMVHSASQMFISLSDFLLAKKRDIRDCRGQSYDNASNMSGKSKNYAAIQTLFLAAAYHLNLIERATHASLALGHTLG